MRRLLRGFAGGLRRPEDEEIKGGQGWGEEKVSHELRLDGEARRVRETERAIGAASAEEGFGAGKAASIKDALNETEDTNDGGGDEEGEEEAGFEVFGGLEEGQKEKDSENGKEKEPDDAGGEEAAERIF